MIRVQVLRVFEALDRGGEVVVGRQVPYDQRLESALHQDIRDFLLSVLVPAPVLTATTAMTDDRDDRLVCLDHRVRGAEEVEGSPL